MTEIAWIVAFTFFALGLCIGGGIILYALRESLTDKAGRT